LIVGVGTNLSALLTALRENGIYVHGPVTVPAAAAIEETAPVGAA
jgi:hypothetical protein